MKNSQNLIVNNLNLTRFFDRAILKLSKTARPDSEQSEHGGFLIL